LYKKKKRFPVAVNVESFSRKQFGLLEKLIVSYIPYW